MPVSGAAEGAGEWPIIADSPAIQSLRARTGLPPATLHVTLGFAPHDIYDRPKDAATHLITVV